MKNQNYLDVKINTLDISIRANNVLRKNGYCTIADVLKLKSKKEILSIRYFSPKCGMEMAKELKRLGVPDNVWYEFLVKTT